MRAGSGESGFSMLELLTAIGIAGVLWAVALPQYAGYREGAFDAEAQSLLRSVAIAEEAYFTDYSLYTPCSQAACVNALSGVSHIADGVVLDVTSNGVGYTASAYHVKGSGKVFTVLGGGA